LFGRHDSSSLRKPISDNVFQIKGKSEISVEGYMVDLNCSIERINQIITLMDGRSLGFAEYGPSNGRVVFFFPGSASSRLDHPEPEHILQRLGIRFISIDRPGLGLSDFQPDRKLLDCAQDIKELAEYLGVERFHVLGHSAGGPHALACAYQLADGVISGAVVSSVAPMGRIGAYIGMPLPNQLLARSARWMPWVTNLIRKLMRSKVMNNTEKTANQLMIALPDSDKIILSEPHNLEWMVSSIQEGFRQGSRAIAQDDVLINREWGFELEKITIRFDIWHGEADVNVPLHAGEYLLKGLPHARSHFFLHEGHFLIIKRWKEILFTLVSI
jgi:pimeloyl-ACP methyl ester carboxylesterase